MTHASAIHAGNACPRKVRSAASVTQSRSVADARRLARERALRALPPGEWLFTREAATVLGVSAAYVQRLAVADRLPHEVTAEGYVFRADHIRRIAEARRVTRSNDPVAALHLRDLAT